jgi:CRISPR-associated endonuclease/helicase Cas3
MAFGDYVAEGRAKETMAAFVQIPRADDNLNDLSALSNREVAEADACTRLGAEAVRVLCCYLDADHGQWLDPGCTRALPALGSGKAGRFRTQDVGEILRETIPVRKSVLYGYQPPASTPTSWKDDAWLADLVLLWFLLGAEGPVATVVNGRRVSLDRELGLVVDLRDDSI